MSHSFGIAAGGLAMTLGLLLSAGCSTQKPAIYEHENFDDAGTFSRNYQVSETDACAAARRALLSQGYIITSNNPTLVSGHKSFQQTGDTHLEISFNVVCAADGKSDHSSTLFANALQDRYALKKVNNSASLGVGVLGSVSMPIGSTDDSMVKVASETVASGKFYDRYFALVESFMPAAVKPVPAPVETPAPKAAEKPGNELGMPEPLESQPLAPPPAPAAIQPQPAAIQSQPAAMESQPAPLPAEPVEEAPAAVPAAPAEAPATQQTP